MAQVSVLCQWRLECDMFLCNRASVITPVIVCLSVCQDWWCLFCKRLCLCGAVCFWFYGRNQHYPLRHQTFRSYTWSAFMNTLLNICCFQSRFVLQLTKGTVLISWAFGVIKVYITVGHYFTHFYSCYYLAFSVNLFPIETLAYEYNKYSDHAWTLESVKLYLS